MNPFAAMQTLEHFVPKLNISARFQAFSENIVGYLKKRHLTSKCILLLKQKREGVRGE